MTKAKLSTASNRQTIEKTEILFFTETPPFFRKYTTCSQAHCITFAGKFPDPFRKKRIFLSKTPLTPPLPRHGLTAESVTPGKTRGEKKTGLLTQLKVANRSFVVAESSPARDGAQRSEREKGGGHAPGDSIGKHGFWGRKKRPPQRRRTLFGMAFDSMFNTPAPPPPG